jgi:hypothetical protein
MAGQNKGNVIEYVFEGNILNLKQSMDVAAKLMKDSAKTFAKTQGVRQNALDKETKAEIKKIKSVRAQLENQALIDPKGEKKETKELFKYYMKLVQQFNAASLKAKKAKIKEENNLEKQRLKQQAKSDAQKEQALAFAKTPAGQEAARVQAEYLSASMKQLGPALSEPAIQDITNALTNYQAALQSTTMSEEEKAEVIVNLDEKFREYDATIRRLKNTVVSSSKGIKNFGDIIEQVRTRIEISVKSISFWISILRRLATYIRQGIQNYSDYVESLNFLRQAADEAADSMQAFTKSQYLAFGLDPKEVNQSTAMFYAFGRSMGFANDELELISKNMSKLAQDYASLQNTDLDTAATKLRSALAGISKGLAVWGTNVTDVNLNEWLASKNINKTMTQMNEASQAAARYAFMIEKASAAQGDLAKTITSPANQLKILKNQFNLFIQSIGAAVLQVIMPLVRMLNMALRPINALLTAMTSAAAEAFSSSIGNTSEDMEDLVSSTEDESQAIKGLAGIDEINQKTEIESETGTGGIDKDIVALLTGYDNLAGTIEPIIVIFDRIGASLAPIFNSLSVMMDPILNFVQSLLNVLGTMLTPLATIGGWIGSLFTVLSPVAELLGTTLTWVADILNTIISRMEFLIPLVIIILGLWATFGWNSFISSLISVAMGFKSIMTSIYGAVKAVVVWIANTIKTIAMNIKNAVSAWIAEKAYWKLAIAAVAAAGVLAIVVMATIATATAATTAKADAATGSEPKMLAQGGVVTGPTMAIVGEGKYDEAVVPLGNSPQFESMKEGIATEVVRNISVTSPSNRGNVTGQPVVLNIDGRTLARAIWPALIDTQNQVGVKVK